MRTLIKVTIPVEAGNKTIKDGRLANTFMGFIERVRPEASYFGPSDGKRTGYFVVDLKDSSGLPPLVEPFFTDLDASVEVTPVMNVDELRSGLDKLRKGT